MKNILKGLSTILITCLLTISLAPSLPALGSEKPPVSFENIENFHQTLKNRNEDLINALSGLPKDQLAMEIKNFYAKHPEYTNGVLGEMLDLYSELGSERMKMGNEISNDYQVFISELLNPIIIDRKNISRMEKSDGSREENSIIFYSDGSFVIENLAITAPELADNQALRQTWQKCGSNMHTVYYGGSGEAVARNYLTSCFYYNNVTVWKKSVNYNTVFLVNYVEHGVGSPVLRVDYTDSNNNVLRTRYLTHFKMKEGMGRFPVPRGNDDLRVSCNMQGRIFTN